MVDSAAVQRTVSGGIAQIGDAAGLVPASDDTASFDLLALVGAALPVADATGISEAAAPKTENDVPDSEIDGVLAALLAAGRLAETGVNAVPPQVVPAETAGSEGDDEAGSEGLDAILSLDETESKDAVQTASDTFALVVPPPVVPAALSSSDDAPEASETAAPEAFIGPPAPRRFERDGFAAAATPETEAAEVLPPPADVPAATVEKALVTAAKSEPDLRAVPSTSDAPVAADMADSDVPPAPPEASAASDLLPDEQVAASRSPAPGPLPHVAEASRTRMNAIDDAAEPAVIPADEPTASAQAAAAPARALQRSEAERAETAAEAPEQTPTLVAAAAAPAVLPQERSARSERRRNETVVASADLPPQSAAPARPEAPAVPPGPAPGTDPLGQAPVADPMTGEADLDAQFALQAAPQGEPDAASGARPDIRSVFASDIVVPQVATASPRAAEPLPTVSLQQTAARDQAPQAVEAPASSAPVMNRAAEMLMADLRNRAVERQILSAIRQGRDEARVTLYPPQLGQVVIRLAMDGQKVRVSMRATNEAAEETLQSGEAGLRDALGRQGFELSGFDVDSRNQEEGRRSPQRPYAAPVVVARDETAGPFSIDVTA